MNMQISMPLHHGELENPALTHINRLPPRSNLIPAGKSGVYYKNKEESCLLQDLNGDYRFQYCDSDCMADFFSVELDESGWDTIDVPSMWQYRNYGTFHYTNIEYAIPFDPPYVHCKNPVGYYRRHFIADPGEKTILHFGGVDNAFYVYLNGTFVGMSKGSRNPAEFDVTGLIRKGENLLAVKVFTYSDATYLENQDMLLANGIFRDVYLLHTGAVSLWDYRVTTDLKGFSLHLELTQESADHSIEVCIKEPVDLSDDSWIISGGVYRRFPAEKEIDTYIAIENPRLWNSEEPNLYDLEIRIVKNTDAECAEIHSKKIGMMHSRVEGSRLLVNGKPVYIKGVNRHEHDCDNGRAISVALIEKELKMIKANHINAIRCSHYTNHPAFYEICSELGIFVMDEADLETHGCYVIGDQGYLSKRKEWLPAYLDRVDRMLKQNKNEVCIFIYSMGNECGEGENIVECLKYTMAYEPDKVAIHDQETNDVEQLFVPMSGEYDRILRAGYLSAANLQKMIDAQPISMQIEYAHAMGNSPGFLEGYQKFVYENEGYPGGFVWEFKNHGFHRVDEKGRDYYLYGGDFGDRIHWYNFCMDGYLMSDGTPKHSWYELGEVFAPVYVTYDGQIHLKNTYNFRNLNSLRLKWEVCEDYETIKYGEMQLPAAEPHEEIVLKLDYMPQKYRNGAVYYLNLHFYDGGEAAGSHQIKLTNVPKLPYQPSAFGGRITTEDENLVIEGDDFRVVLEKGMLRSYELGGVSLLDEPFTFNLYRAPTDNDGILGMAPGFWRNAENWNYFRLDMAKFIPMEITAELQGDRAVCRASGKVIPPSKYLGFTVELEYQIYQSGLIAVSMEAIPFGNLPDKLPRIGLCFPMRKEYQQISWYGRGPRENYSDCKKASPIGFYSKPVRETYTVFDMPQETGNHENTSFVLLQNHEKQGLVVVGCDEFAFSYHDFTLENLTKARHKNELEESDHNYLYVDYKMRGLGSHSCGPEPEEAYELHPHAFVFAFLLGGNCTPEDALELARTDFGVRTSSLDTEGNVSL